MKKKRTLIAVAMFTLSGAAMTAPRPALAWDRAWCQTPAAAPYATWCAYKYPNPAPGSSSTASATANASASASAEQQQMQSLTNRLTQSLSNVGNPYTVVHEGAQLGLTNAPECGGVNWAGSVGWDQGFAGQVGAAIHTGPKPDSCNHYDTPAPVVNVHVDAPVAAVAPQPQVVYRDRVHETVYVEPSKPACPPDASRKQDLALLHRERRLLRYRPPTQEMLEAADRLCVPRDTLYALDDPK